jgi:uncharacterized protein YndB with AHSA1/START domain
VTEIRVDVNLEHPPALVWRGFTEAHLVTDWLPATRFMLRDNGTFTFHAGELAGLEDPIEGELVTVEPPHRLVMRWQATNLHTVVALTLTERDGGSHLALTQSGFLGPQGTMRRRVLRATYTSLFEGPLAATLARIAREEERPDPAAPPGQPPTAPRRNDGGPFNRLPRQPNAPSRSAPGLSSQTRSTAGPRPTTPVPGFAAAVMNARATGVAKVTGPAADGPGGPGDAPGPPSEPTVTVPAQPAASRPGEVRTARLGAAAAQRDSLVRRGWRRLASARDWSADRRSQAVATGAAVLLLLAMAAILIGKATALHPAKPPRTGGGSPGPVQVTVPAAPGQPSSSAAEPIVPATTRSQPAAQPASPAATPTGTTASAQLSAQYKTEDLTLTSYRVTITIANPTQTVAGDWSVEIVLPLLDLSIRNVEGAVTSRSGARVTFTPLDATRTVKPSTTVTLRFDVEGLGVRNEPFTCTIDGRNCARIPG